MVKMLRNKHVKEESLKIVLHCLDVLFQHHKGSKLMFSELDGEADLEDWLCNTNEKIKINV